jgi:hypothetical protein
MFETMKEYQGIGLAAPQVHQGLRLFVAGFAPDEPEEDEDGAIDDEEATSTTCRRWRSSTRRSPSSGARPSRTGKAA